MRSVSKPFFLASVVGALGLSWLCGLLAEVFLRTDRPNAVVPLRAAAGVLALGGLAVALVLVYRMWAALQGGGARTTPGLAVGLLFVPVFNLYWVFQVFWGWAVDYNSHVVRRGLRAPRFPEGLALWLSTLLIVSPIPLVGYATGLAALAVAGIYFAAACDAVNALATGAANTPGFSTFAEACQICGARLDRHEQANGVCTPCLRRA